MLKTFAMDYDFLQIEVENKKVMNSDLKKELDYRYEHFLNHADEYKDWDTLKDKYIKQ